MKETRCSWCGKSKRKLSEWEQNTLKGEWKQMCVACANRRLNNPYNALLQMRKMNRTTSERGEGE